MIRCSGQSLQTDRPPPHWPPPLQCVCGQDPPSLSLLCFLCNIQPESLLHPGAGVRPPVEDPLPLAGLKPGGTYSFTHSLSHSFIHSVTYLHIPSPFIHSLINLLTHSFSQLFIHSITHHLTHSYPHLFTHSLIHSFID